MIVLVIVQALSSASPPIAATARANLDRQASRPPL